MINPWLFLTDPVLRAPTIGCMLMCLAASLVGVIVLLRRQALIGEALSHAAYPGAIFGALLTGILASEWMDWTLAIFSLLGAFSSALLGIWVIHILEKKLRVPSDAALCLVLSVFFGIGLTLTSEVQFSHTAIYRQVLTYFYGQAATMTSGYIVIYGILALIVVLIIFLFYKEWQVMIFDRVYAKSLGIPVRHLDALLFVLIALSVIIGMRSVGVVLMSAMLIAPAATARQLTHRLDLLFLLAALFGVMSGFLGNYFSVVLSDTTSRLILPTGPMIVAIASLFCICALLFAPERGFIVRLVRMMRFRHRCLVENVLKALWRLTAQQPITLEKLAQYQATRSSYLRLVLWQLMRGGWVRETEPAHYELTPDGRHRAAKIVRLHRLWEVYLVDYLGVNAERVHCSAEEMEHILTPELERELIELLNDPKRDPHHQPIPPKEGLDAW